MQRELGIEEQKLGRGEGISSPLTHILIDLGILIFNGRHLDKKNASHLKNHLIVFICLSLIQFCLV